MLRSLDSAVCLSGHGLEPQDSARPLATPCHGGVARGQSA